MVIDAANLNLEKRELRNKTEKKWCLVHQGKSCLLRTKLIGFKMFWTNWYYHKPQGRFVKFTLLHFIHRVTLKLLVKQRLQEI